MAIPTKRENNEVATERGGEPGDYAVELTVDLGGLEAEVRAARVRMDTVQSELVEVSRRWRALATSMRAISICPCGIPRQ